MFDGNTSQIIRKTRHLSKTEKTTSFSCEANREYEIICKIRSLETLKKMYLEPKNLLGKKPREIRRWSKATQTRLDNLYAKLEVHKKIDRQYCPKIFKYMSDKNLLNKVFGI